MQDENLNANDDMSLSFVENNIDNFIENILPSHLISDNDENIDIQFETVIDDTIEKLEKILKLEALSDDELAELHTVTEELQDDIDILDFDGEY